MNTYYEVPEVLIKPLNQIENEAETKILEKRALNQTLETRAITETLETKALTKTLETRLKLVFGGICTPYACVHISNHELYKSQNTKLY